MSHKKTLKTFIKEAKEIHGDKYSYNLSVYENSRTRLKIICPIHGEFLQEPHTHLNSKITHGCPKCGTETAAYKRKKAIDRLLSELRLIHPQLIFPNIDCYKNNKESIEAQCLVHGTFHKSINSFLSKKEGCPACGYIIGKRKQSLTLEEFIKRSSKIHNNKYDYSQTMYTNKENKVNIICPIHGIFKQHAGNHINGSGCKKCSSNIEGLKKRAVAAEKLVESFRKTHKNKFNYSLVCYKNCITPVVIICPKHGSFFQTPSNHMSGAGCPSCKQSRGERAVFHELKKHSINFTQNKKFTDCKDKRCLPFDFYVPGINTCIEYDGQLHYKKYSECFKGTYKLEITKKHDSIKTEYCKTKGIILIRIPYWRYKHIENIVLGIRNQAINKSTNSMIMDVVYP